VTLWQFVTFTVLIAALLVYAMVIARRLGRVDVRFKRIEEALLEKSRSIHSADTRAAEAKPQVSDRQEDGGGYLTMRELRQLGSRAAPSSTGAVVSEKTDALIRALGPMRSPGTTPERGGSVRIGSESPLTVNSVPTIFESRDAPATNSGRQSPADCRPPGDDSDAKRNRDMMLFLSNQRRRRRARLGY
jgi:hypothetical protein